MHIASPTLELVSAARAALSAASAAALRGARASECSLKGCGCVSGAFGGGRAEAACRVVGGAGLHENDGCWIPHPNLIVGHLKASQQLDLYAG